MKLTVDLTRLLSLIGRLRGQVADSRRTDPRLRLSACQARVFVESGGKVAGDEALVLEDGCCVVPRIRFEKVLRTCLPRPHVTIEADARCLRIERFGMEVLSYSSTATAPDQFNLPPVTDTWLTATSSPASVRPRREPDPGRSGAA